MRPLRALVIYIVVVFLGGALLAPWLFKLAQAGAHNFPILADVPFHRCVNRSLLLLALAGLWPLLRGLGAQSARDLGLVEPAGQGGKLFVGLLLGLVSLAALATLALVGGARAIQPNLLPATVAGKLFSAALTAGLVAVMEEILFRGGIFTGLRRVLDWRFALVVSSMIYALAHFFARTQDPVAVNWLSGVDQLGLMLRGFADWRQVIPGFFNLTLAGALLALACQRTGNLYCSIGLHAGWVFWLKSYGALTTEVPRADLWLWGSSRMIDGWLALVVLGLTLVVFAQLPLARETNSEKRS